MRPGAGVPGTRVGGGGSHHSFTTSEVVISGQKPATWAYAEAFIAEDDVIERARSRGEELGCTPVSAGVGAALRLLAASLPARSVVEIGTGAGVSGLWLLQGMPSDGVLTTIDVEPEHQRAAREAYAEAGVAGNRTRVITGRALDVLPRLTDGAYDLVLCDAAKPEYDDYLEQAVRLLRRGGVVAFDNALWHDKVADPAQRDETTTAIRELGSACAPTSGSCPRCCRPATACSSPSSASRYPRFSGQIGSSRPCFAGTRRVSALRLTPGRGRR